VIIIIDVGTYGGIVLIPFGSGKFTIFVSVTEVLEEFKENLVGGLVSGDDLWVL
jgi:hypothetical protein